MCGFAGFAITQRNEGDPPEKTIRRMVREIAHRGPDDEAFWQDPPWGVYLGFRRLAILDLSPAGRQPMLSTTGRYVLLFNGEVYNFKSLRAELEEAGRSFRSGSDTEVILAGMEAWGVQAAVARLHGMFGIAVWDTEDRELWLARDRMGIKPLYVYRNGSHLIFGSELRALLQHPAIPRRGNAEVAQNYLRHLFVPGNASIIQDVERVAPGTLERFRVDSHEIRHVGTERYWDLRDVARTHRPSGVDEDEAIDGLHERLTTAVKDRLVADVPIGALLSGGVDSSLVVALMAEQASGPVRTFTISFDDRDFDEGPAAREVANILGTEHTEVTLSPNEVRAMMPEFGALADEPTANPSIIPTLLVSRVARRDVVVALSGDGGDELFGGYNRYVDAPRLIRLAGRVPTPLRRGAAGVAEWVGSRPALADRLSSLLPDRYGAQHSVASRLERVAGILSARSDYDAYREFLAVGHRVPPVSTSRSSDSLGGRDLFASAAHQDLVSRMMLLDQSVYLPDDLLWKVDRASMWTALEARVPILDHRVVEYSWSLPASLLIRDGQAKYPLRRLLRRYLPDSTVDRPKMGFTVPLGRWLRTDLSEWLGDTLAESRLNRRGLYDVAAVNSLLSDFRGGHEHRAPGLWALAVLEDWCDRRGVAF